MLGDEASAREFSEHLLAVTGRAMETGDFETFADCFELPQDLETFEGRRLIKTREELEKTFRGVRAYYQKVGVTQVVRHCIEARFRSVDVIEATHESRILSGSILIKKPYPVFSILHCREGVWRIHSSQYAMTGADELARVIGMSGETSSD